MEIDLVQVQKEYVIAKFGKLPTPNEIALGIVGEVGELALNKDFLPWKKKNDICNIKEEIGDIFFFILELCAYYDISYNELIEQYMDKLNFNKSRQDHEKIV